MDAPREEFYPEPRTEALMVLFRVISRRSWNDLQSWREAIPGSRVEHILYGIYALTVPPGGARRLAR